jgi:hypothetical protein
MQLHVMDTWTAMDPTKLPREERVRALLSLLFLKKNQTGTIKGWACINGMPQRPYIAKEDAALPTVSSESTFIIIIVSNAAKEKRMVRCYNVPSTFMNTDVDKKRADGTQGRTSRDYGTNSASDLPKVYHNGQERNKDTLCETAKSALWTNEGKSTIL